jgi:hypothetical protein
MNPKLALKRLYVARGQHRPAAAAGAENIGSTFSKQGLPRRDLVRVDVKMLRKPGQGHLALDGGSATLDAGVWFCPTRLLIVSLDSPGTACRLSGRNSTYRHV